MANHFSAIKRMRQEERRSLVNRMRRTRVRNQIRILRRLILDKNANGAQTALPATFSLIDRAAKWGVIKKNTAARYKSRLHAKIKALLATAA